MADDVVLSRARARPPVWWAVTLQTAELDLARCFDDGMAYVALSRVTSLDGLWIRGGRITQAVVKAHPSVLAFYRSIGCAV